MPNILDVGYLRLIREIGRQGGLAAAARSLNLTPSALSHRLKQLESRLGRPLFDRVGRGLAFNAAGREVLELAERVLGDLEAGERALAQGASGPLRIAGDCHTAYPWLAEKILSGRIQAELRPQATRRCAEALLKGEIDVAVTPVEIFDSRLTDTVLWDEEMVALCPSTQPLAAARWIEPADLVDQHVLAHTCDDLVLKNFLHKAGVHPRSVVTEMVTEAACALARAGAGIAVMGRWSCRGPVSRGLAVLPLGEGGQRRSWRVTRLRERRADARIMALIEALGSGPPPE